MTTDTYYDDPIGREDFLVAVKQQITELRTNLSYSADSMASYYDGDLDVGGSWLYDQYYKEAKRDAKRALKDLTFWTEILKELTKED